MDLMDITLPRLSRPILFWVVAIFDAPLRFMKPGMVFFLKNDSKGSIDSTESSLILHMKDIVLRDQHLILPVLSKNAI